MTLYRNTSEGGTNGTTITVANSGGGSGDAYTVTSHTGAAVLQYSTDHPTKESMGIKFAAASGETSLVGFTVTGKNVAGQIDCLRLASWPTVANTPIVQFRDAVGIRCSVQARTDGKLEVLDDNGVFVTGMLTTGTLPADLSNIQVDARVEVGTTTSNGKVVLAYGPLGGPATETLTSTTADLGTTDLTNVRFLKPNSSGAITGAYADNVAAADGVTAFITPATNAAPTANAGGDQTIAAGTTLILAGSGSDTDGTIASYAWVKVSGPTITLTNAATATASVTAIPVGHYVFGLTVTDNLGATSTQATAAVSVRATSSRPDSLVANPGGFTIVGGSATIYAALADESDATYVETLDNPSSAYVEVGVQPLADGQVDVLYRLAVSATTPARTCVTDLRSGGTVIASDTHATTDVSAPLTTSAQTYTLTLNPTQMSALAAISGGRNDLRLRHTWS